MISTENLILKRFHEKEDILDISRKLNIPLSFVIETLKKKGLSTISMKNIIKVKDKIDRNLKYMKNRHNTAMKINSNLIKVKLRKFLKIPRTTWECFDHVKIPYKKLYAILKDIGVKKSNALSPVSIDLLLSLKNPKNVNVFKWRKIQQKELKRKHYSFMKKIRKMNDEYKHIHDQIIGEGGIIERVFSDVEIYTDYLSIECETYPSFVIPIQVFFDLFKKINIAQKNLFTYYQIELILGQLLRTKTIELIGFKKESMFFTDKGGYPLFIINNETFKDVVMGTKKAKIAIEKRINYNAISKMKFDKIMYDEFKNLKDKEIEQEIFDNILNTFDPNIHKFLEIITFGNHTLLFEIYKYVIFDKNNMVNYGKEKVEKRLYSMYNVKDDYDYTIISDVRSSIIQTQVNKVFAEGFIKYYNKITLDDIISSLFKFEEKNQFCFYLLCRIFGVPTFEKLSKYYFKNMKPRKPKDYKKNKKR